MIKIEDEGIVLYSFQEVTKFLKVSLPTIRVYCKKGWFGPVVPIGRTKHIQKECLFAYLNGDKVSNIERFLKSDPVYQYPVNKEIATENKNNTFEEKESDEEKENRGKRKKKRLFGNK